MADYVGAAHAVAVSSCTTALHLGLVAAGVGPGDEVVCPSFSFIATANAIRAVGATPVFADVDPRTYNIDPARSSAALTPRTRAILPVSQIGLPADLPAVLDVAERTTGWWSSRTPRRRSARRSHGQTPGGDVGLTCFSFDARKIITTGEGGMVTTDDADVAARMRCLRAHGASVSTADRDRAEGSCSRPTPRSASTTRSPTSRPPSAWCRWGELDEIVVERRRLVARYDELLGGDERVERPTSRVGYEHVYQSYSVRLRGSRIAGGRDAEMLELGVATRRIFAIHDQPAYAGTVREGALPVTEPARRPRRSCSCRCSSG